MKKLFRKFKWLSILFSSLLIVAGILVIVMSIVDKTVIGDIISITTAVILFLFGDILLSSGIFTTRDHLFDIDLLVGSFILTIGILLCINRQLLPELAVTILSIILISFGAALFIKSITLIVYKYKNIPAIASGITFGAISIATGTLFLLFHSQVLQGVYIIIGVLVMLTGVYSLIVSIQLAKIKY